jgi:DNA-binding SARP family transcriptional activator
MLEIRLFGAGQLHINGTQPGGFPNHQAFLLLCYLLLNRRYPLQRESLAAVFWGDCSTSASRKALRNALWRLRQAFSSVGASADDYLAIHETSIAFCPMQPYWFDVESFENVAGSYQDVEGQDLTDTQAGELESASELYKGDLLESVYDDWCLHDRERLRLLHLNVLGKLVTYYGSHGQFEHGLACGERILSSDPVREKTHRSMMWLHWLAGNRAAALAQYKRCAQVLKEELGVAPMEQTQQLYKQMLHGTFDPAYWPLHREAPAGHPAAVDETNQQLIEHAMQKLRQIQAMIDAANAELYHIEHAMRQAAL